MKNDCFSTPYNDIRFISVSVVTVIRLTIFPRWVILITMLTRLVTSVQQSRIPVMLQTVLIFAINQA